MNIIQAILMGIVQGLSEFLPISSSAHLVLTSNFYKIFNGLETAGHSNEEVFFDIMVHFGTLIAVLIFFEKDIMNILKSMYNALKTHDWSDNNAKIGLYITTGTVVTILIAAPLEGIAQKLVYSPVIVSGLLIITGLILLYCERKSRKNLTQNLDKVTLKTSIIIGVAQGIAALPGFSRSGCTIAAGLLFGLDRAAAARYSFLLSIPIILGASIFYPFLKTDINEAMTYNWSAIITGTLISAVTGYFCIKYFMKFIMKFSLNIFGYYCMLLGTACIIFFSICG